MSEPDLCFLCKSQFTRPKDKYLIEGRSKENLPFELNDLPFRTPFNSGDYLCRNCVYALKKRRRLIEQLREVEEKLQSQFEKESLGSPSSYSGVKRSITEDDILQSKRPHSDTPCVSEKFDFGFGELSPCKPLLHSTPVKSITSATCGEISVPTQKARRTAEEPTKQHSRTNVFVKVEWPSKDRERQLPPDFESLGKMLVRGTYKQIACAVWNNRHLKKELLLNVMKDVDKECANLCSKKKPSCLRSPTKDQLLNFSMKKLDTELQERIPITYAMLTAASVNAREKTKLRSNEEENYSIAVGMAAAVCLRNRSMFMNAVQLQISIFTYHTGWLATLRRLQSLRLTVSHTHLYRKLTEFGQGYKLPIEEAVQKQSKFMASANMMRSDGPHTNFENCDGGRKIVLDNFDYHQNVHCMTEEHQNIDHHYVTLMATENRVTGCNLSSSKQIQRIKDMDNRKCIPDTNDHVQQRKNYVNLVERIMVKNIPCMKFLTNVVTMHIPHQYSKEMRSKSNTVSSYTF